MTAITGTGSGRDADSSPRASLRELTPVLISVVLALATFLVATSLYPRPLLRNDAYNYSMSAQRLAYHGVYAFGAEPPGEHLVPNAIVTPGYVAFLSGFYAAAADRSIEGSDAARTVQPFVVGVQFILALGIVALVGGAGLVLGGARMAYVAGGLAAIYLPFAWSATVGLRAGDCLGTFLVALQLLIALRLTRHSGSRSWLEFAAFGFVSAALALVRPALVLWAVAPVLYLAIGRLEDPRRLARMTGVTLACLLLVMAPWWVRNAVVLDKFVPLSTAAGDPMLISSGGVALNAAERAVADEAMAEGHDGLSAAAVYRMRKQFASDPGGFIGNRIIRIAQAAHVAWNVPRGVMWDERQFPDIPSVGFGSPFPGRPSALLFLTWVWADYYHLGLLAAAVLGLFTVRRSPQLALVASFPVYVCAIHFLILFIDRYFFPSYAIGDSPCRRSSTWLMACHQKAGPSRLGIGGEGGG